MREQLTDPKTKVIMSNSRKNYIDIDSPASSDYSDDDVNSDCSDNVDEINHSDSIRDMRY
jgi:hypothetical protein